MALAAVLVAALAVYLPYALRAGWYYDDWDLYSLFQDTAGGVGADVQACAQHMPGGRKVVCVYHAVEYNLLGDHRTAYHLVAIGFLVLVGGLGYAVLRRCHVPRVWGALAAVMLVVFPASDSTRLWPVSASAQYVLAMVLAAQLISLVALGRRGRSAAALHALSAILAVLAMVTYEIAVPLVALSWALYLLAYRRPRVLWRGALDLGLVVAFSVWRLALSPPTKESGFVVKRSLGETVDRASRLLETTWTTWKFVYAPGVLGTFALVVLAILVAALAAREPIFRRRALPWAVGLSVAVLFVATSSLVFLTANDLYMPTVGSTFNRLNLPGSLAAAVAFVALLALIYEAGRHVVPASEFASSAVGAVSIAVVAMGIGWHQLGISSDHKRAWESSWNLQRAALDGYRVALRDVPHGARILGFDTPLWEAGFVPVFSASWDLRGAIDYTTNVDPPSAIPWTAQTHCGPDAVTFAGESIAPYRDDAHPWYLVSPRRRRALAVHSSSACRRVVERWGVPPFWSPRATVA